MAEEMTMRQSTLFGYCPHWAIENDINNALLYVQKANTAIESACLDPNGRFFSRLDHEEADKAAHALLFDYVEGVTDIFKNMVGLVVNWSGRAR